MKSKQLTKLCEDLYSTYKADPVELFLTPASKVELTNDLISIRVSDSPRPESEVVGADLRQVVNPVTRSVIDVFISEQPYDSMIAELILS